MRDGQLNASSPVFYLEQNNGGLSHRTCEVPAGKALFIPVMTVEESDKESPGASDQDLSKSATTDQDSANSLYLKIGDKEYNYQDLLKYRVHIDAYNLNFANNGIFGIIQGGPTRDVADGFFVMTEPLAKGTYLFISNPVVALLQPRLPKISHIPLLHNSPVER
jgi:hypothetical protein